MSTYSGDETVPPSGIAPQPRSFLRRGWLFIDIMKTMERQLYIRDPIHGNITLSPSEFAILNTQAFQRLRHIRQLGLTDLVFPGATHTRFSHSIGVMHLAERMLTQVFTRVPESLIARGERPRMVKLMRYVGLLHDLGHPPFSHALEDLFEPGFSHEEMARRIVLETEISEIIRHYGPREGVALEDVVSLLAGRPSRELEFLRTVLSSELDIDKMDYLQRDSTYCGVRYGFFDLERLLYTSLCLKTADGLHLGVHESGIHALEAFVLARYYMFAQVYFNLTSKILELHLKNFFNTLNLRWSTKVGEFLMQDDVWVYTLLKQHAGHPDARAVLYRKHHPLLLETEEHLSPVKERRFAARLRRLTREHPDWRLFVSLASKDPHRFAESRILVADTRGKVFSVEKVSSFISYLKKINQFRLYGPRNLARPVQAFFGKQFR